MSTKIRFTAFIESVEDQGYFKIKLSTGHWVYLNSWGVRQLENQPIVRELGPFSTQFALLDRLKGLKVPLEFFYRFRHRGDMVFFDVEVAASGGPTTIVQPEEAGEFHDYEAQG